MSDYRVYANETAGLIDRIAFATTDPRNALRCNNRGISWYRLYFDRGGLNDPRRSSTGSRLTRNDDSIRYDGKTYTLEADVVSIDDSGIEVSTFRLLQLAQVPNIDASGVPIPEAGSIVYVGTKGRHEWCFYFGQPDAMRRIPIERVDMCRSPSNVIIEAISPEDPALLLGGRGFNTGKNSILLPGMERYVTLKTLDPWDYNSVINDKTLRLTLRG